MCAQESQFLTAQIKTHVLLPLFVCLFVSFSLTLGFGRPEENSCFSTFYDFISSRRIFIQRFSIKLLSRSIDRWNCCYSEITSKFHNCLQRIGKQHWIKHDIFSVEKLKWYFVVKHTLSLFTTSKHNFSQCAMLEWGSERSQTPVHWAQCSLLHVQ